MQEPRINIGIFLVLFFLLGIIPGIIYLIIKGNEVSRYHAMVASMPPPGASPSPPTPVSRAT